MRWLRWLPDQWEESEGVKSCAVRRSVAHRALCAVRCWQSQTMFCSGPIDLPRKRWYIVRAPDAEWIVLLGLCRH